MEHLIASGKPADVPEDATHFECEKYAIEAGDRFVPKTKTWKVDEQTIRGELLHLVKFWPKESTEISGGRKWLKLVNKRKKRKQDGEETRDT